MNTLTLPIIDEGSSLLHAFGVPRGISYDLAIQDDLPLKQRVTQLLIHDLLRLGWSPTTSSRQNIELVPPASYDKPVVKAAMAHSRNDMIEANRDWIADHLELARSNLAPGNQVLDSEIIPRIELCKTQKQHDIFRLFRYSWSSPSSEYVGRRLRLLIRDDGINGSPLIGIAALGSSIIHIPARDEWIGWNTKTRTNRIIYMMDAYVIGAVPPYNHLLGGKLVSYALASNELRKMYMAKYAGERTGMGRSASDLVLIVTTSLYGEHSSQYNRLKYGKTLLYEPIGVTSGYGSLHVSAETFRAMLRLASEAKCNVSNRFGDGPNWRMRVIRGACDVLGLDSDVILKHSFPRGLYAVRLARNWKAFLKGEADKPLYRNMPLEKLANYWHIRWLSNRKRNEEVVNRVRGFLPGQFTIDRTEIGVP